MQNNLSSSENIKEPNTTLFQLPPASHSRQSRHVPFELRASEVRRERYVEPQPDSEHGMNDPPQVGVGVAESSSSSFPAAGHVRRRRCRRAWDGATRHAAHDLLEQLQHRVVWAGPVHAGEAGEGIGGGRRGGRLGSASAAGREAEHHGAQLVVRELGLWLLWDAGAGGGGGLVEVL